MDGFEIYLALEIGILQDGLDLGPEQQPVWQDSVKQGLLAHTVARQEPCLLVLIPQRKSKHAPQALNAVLALLFPEVDDDLGIGVRAKAMALVEQFTPQFHEIVNLTVKRDPDRAILVRHRLLPK